MPSTSFIKFKTSMLKDVENLMTAYDNDTPGGRGRKSLGHYTRSATIMLCAAWELYLEEVFNEYLTQILKVAQSPKNIPTPLQQKLCSYVKSDKNALKPLDLCGSGWKNVLYEMAEERISKFNTPKPNNIDTLFLDYFNSDISSKWSSQAQLIEDFVKVRGEIAHRGDAKYVTYQNVVMYISLIKKTVLETDNFIAQLCHTQMQVRPWKRKSCF